MAYLAVNEWRHFYTTWKQTSELCFIYYSANAAANADNSKLHCYDKLLNLPTYMNLLIFFVKLSTAFPNFSLKIGAFLSVILKMTAVSNVVDFYLQRGCAIVLLLL